MDLRVCEYCGTEFSADLTECPLCGKAVDPSELDFSADAAEEAAASQSSAERRTETRKPGRHLAGKQKKQRGGRFAKDSRRQKREEPAEQEPQSDENLYRIPKWMMVLICVFLGLAVAIGAAFALYNLGVFGKRTSSLSAASSQAASASQSAAASASSSAAGSATESKYTNEEDYAAEQAAQSSKPAAVTCTGITLGKSTITFEEADAFDNLTYTVEPSDCTQEVTFESSDESIATVNAQGKVVAVKGGSATITVKCGTKSAECLVTCDFKTAEQTQEQTPPILSSTDMTLFYPGEQATLTVKNAPTGASVSFSSADETVAAVTSAGVVSAVGSGQTTVTVKVNDQTLSCIVRCKLEDSAENANQDTNCTLSHSDVTMSIAGEYFKISLKDSGGSTVSGLSWSSSDNSVCTVDSSGVVYAAGNGTAYVSTTYGGKTYQCIVRCHIS